MAYCILKQKFGCIEINYCNSGIKNRQIKIIARILCMHTTVNLGKGTLYDVIFCNSAYLLHLLYSVCVVYICSGYTYYCFSYVLIIEG